MGRKTRSDETIRVPAICHGDQLRGLGELPRKASYIALQLICILRTGLSAGTAVALMKKVASNVSEDDIIAISAYLGRSPRSEYEATRRGGRWRFGS